MSFPALAQEYNGKVIGVTDGDTFTLLSDAHQQYKIRLAEIDTPEKGQPYGQKAKKALSDLIFQQDVKVIQTDLDRYGRVVGKVYKNDTYINAAMIEAGAAWVYRKYAQDKNLYNLEAVAKEQRIGLWNLPEAEITPPWQWRMEQRRPEKDQYNTTYKPTREETTISSNERQEKVRKRSSDDNTGRSCGSKRYCKQMSSCSEARFYLTECGLSRLDGDGDGVPCESLCR